MSSFRKTLVEDIVETCAATGCLIKKFPNKENLIEYQHAPISLFQTPYPLSIYKQVEAYQHPIGVLVSNLTAAPHKIGTILDSFLKYDQFLAQLVKIGREHYSYAKSDNPERRKLVQHVHMCVLRCDFMLDAPSNSCKLVEYNTIASSFGCLSQKLKDVQEYIRTKYEGQIKYNYSPINPSDYTSEEDRKTIAFASNQMDTFLESMVEYFQRAIKEYKRTLHEKFGIESKDPWVLFVVEDSERNVIDQKLIEYHL